MLRRDIGVGRARRRAARAGDQEVGVAEAGDRVAAEVTPDQTSVRLRPSSEASVFCRVGPVRSCHNPKIRNEERPDSSRTAPNPSSLSNSRVAAQRDRLLPGAEAATASSWSSF